MRIIAYKPLENKGGFTLIELMIALLIMLISMTAIGQFLVKYQLINIENTMRDEARNISESQMETYRNTNFASLALGTTTATQTRKIRNISVVYTLTTTIQEMSTVGAASCRAIRINVTWTYRNIGHRYDAATIIAADL